MPGSLYALIAALALGLIVLSILLRRASQLASRSQARFRTVLDSIKDGVFILNADRSIAFVNKTGNRLISMPAEGSSYSVVNLRYDAFTPDGSPLTPDEWPSARALRGDFVENLRLAFREKTTGELGSRLVTTAPFATTGHPDQIIVVYHDDSERQRVDLLRSRLADIVESTDDAIISTSIEGIVTSWNRGAENITGYPAGEILNQSITRLLPPEEPDTCREIAARILNREPVSRFEAVRLTSEGRRIQVEIATAPLKNQDGEILGISYIVRDITETRSLQRQLQQSQKMEALGQLTGGVAHDFNNLLGIVIGNLELLELKLADDEHALHRTLLAKKASVRCADLTRRLLAFSSSQQLKPAPTHLEHSVRNMLEMATRALGPDITFSTAFTPSLPLIFVDPASLESALLNLALNARDAMPSGGCLQVATEALDCDEDSPLVTSGRLTPGHYAVVAISDNGHGMSKATQERVFEPFFTTKERGRGTGLGLAIVYGFATQSKGGVSIYSEEGLGTTVSLYLPIAPDETASAKPSVTEAPRVGGTILLVDDEPDLLDIASSFLTRIGYQTLTALNAEEALRLVAEPAPIDLMLTDVIMPGSMTGVELAQSVRDLRPAIKILYASGFPADALGRRNLLIEPGALLNKPYRLADLSNAIREALSS